jgi:hypothetical protein
VVNIFQKTLARIMGNGSLTRSLTMNIQDLNIIIGEYLPFLNLNSLSIVYQTNEWNCYDNCVEETNYFVHMFKIYRKCSYPIIIPEGFHELIFYKIYHSDFMNIPKSVQKLTIDNGGDCVTYQFPEHIFYLKINNFYNLYINFPKYLYSLFLINCLYVLTNLPIGLHDLELISCYNIKKIENLPKGLKKLKINSMVIDKIENLPDGLKHLDLNMNYISKIEGLPNGLKYFNISSNPIKEIENLPNDLQILYIRGTSIDKIKNLPQNLKELYIKYTKIKKIENLPKSLELLELDLSSKYDIIDIHSGLEISLRY